MDGYFSNEELKQFHFKSCGENVLISRKASLYLTEQMSFGSNIRIDDFCSFVGDVTVGDYAHFAPYTMVHGTAGGRIVFKDYTGVSSYVAFYAGDDDYSGNALFSPMWDKKYLNVHTATITVERYVLIGCKCLILPGAYLAEGISMGAMSILSKPTEPWGIYAGIPCRRVKERSKKLIELVDQALAEKQQNQ